VVGDPLVIWEELGGVKDQAEEVSVYKSRKEAGADMAV
jgi:hypothetical protein